MRTSKSQNCKWNIITVTHNSSRDITRYWRDQIPNSVRWTVVDNDSTDVSSELCRELGAEVIELKANLGFSAANNIALNQSTSEYICFANPDVKVNFADLKILENYLDENLAIVSPQLINLDGSLQPNARNHPYLISKISNRLPFETQMQSRYQIRPTFIGAHEVPWLMGAVIIGKKDTFDLISGWDEDFFLYYEDTDLCIRAKNAGIRVILVNQFRWAHAWNRDTTKLNIKSWKREIQSAFTFYKKYPKYLGWPSRGNHEA